MSDIQEELEIAKVEARAALQTLEAARKRLQAAREAACPIQIGQHVILTKFRRNWNDPWHEHPARIVSVFFSDNPTVHDWSARAVPDTKDGKPGAFRSHVLITSHTNDWRLPAAQDQSEPSDG